MVIKLCDENGVKFHNVPFVEANMHLIDHMKDAAYEARRTGKYNFF